MTTEKPFEIPLADGRIVYMRCGFDRPSPYYDVVWIDAKKFRKIWDNPENYQDEEQWKAWKYYPDAEEAFSRSKDWPVPLADVGTPFNGKVRFNNGITRTTWLLINGAKSFPIACSPEYVPALEALAGA